MRVLRRASKSVLPTREGWDLSVPRKVAYCLLLHASGTDGQVGLSWDLRDIQMGEGRQGQHTHTTQM